MIIIYLHIILSFNKNKGWILISGVAVSNFAVVMREIPKGANNIDNLDKKAIFLL